MLKLALRGVRHNIGRYIATMVAILTGVAFFTATGFLSDRVIDALEGDVNRQYAAVDAAVVVDDEAESTSSFADSLRIGEEAADQIAALPEVEAVGGDLNGNVAFLGLDGEPFAEGATGRLWIVDEELNPTEIEEGRGPAASGEIAIDQGLADDEDLAVGDDVTVLTLGGPFDATIVGITSFGRSDAQDRGGTVSISEADAFDWLNSGQREFQDLLVRGTVPEAELAEAIEPLVPSGFEVQTGTDFLEEKRDEAAGFGRVLKIGLQAFAALALFVGAFVIYNTFSVIVAQRLRELAVLAAIGATPKQIKRSLRYEGLLIGVLGSALGVLAGFALAFLLVFVVSQLGVALPGSGIKVTSTPIIQGLIAGTVITYLSVMMPARRAARTEPIEALRQAAVESSALTRKRIIASAVMVGLGMLGMLAGGNGFVIGLAALILFIGVIVAGPVIAIGGNKIFRPVMSLFGLEGRLASDNTARNPRRTATTANALLIGVFLVTLVTVAGTSVKDFAVSEINELSSADYIIQSDGGTIDDELVANLEAVDGVTLVTPFRREPVSIEGGSQPEEGGGAGLIAPSAISTGDIEALTGAAKIELAEGSFEDLVPGTVLLLDDGETEVGAVVTFENSKGETVDLEVVGLVDTSLDTALTGSLVDQETFDAFVGDTAPTVAFVNVETGAQTDVEDSIEEITDLRPDIGLLSGNELGRLIGSIFQFLINAVNGLLLMSVIVALIGIVNTLSLSILERRRELGLLRIVGMVDRRVKRMVRLESILISALGTITGMLLGAFTGLALILSIDRLTDANIGLSWSPGLLLLILVLGIVLGFLAALIPAHRSTRLSVLDAINAP